MMEQDNTIRAKARSDAYAMLAIGFGYPGEDLFQGLAEGQFASTLSGMVQRAYPQLQDDLAPLAPQLITKAGSVQQQESEYLRVFETDVPKPALSLYETSYRSDTPRAQLLLELNAFYRHFGLMIDSTFRELEDSLTAELEFMQFLSAKEWQARNCELRPEPYRLAQRDFLDRHLARWLPKMAEAANGCHSPFYRALATVASRFVTADLDHVKSVIEEQFVPTTA